MVPKELNDWLQVIGLFGVLGGLIFVGLQLSLDRQVAVAERSRGDTANAQYWAELLTNNTDVWIKSLAGDPLSESEAAQFDALATARMRLFFDSNIQGRYGLSQSPQFAAARAARLIHESPGLQRWWSEDRSRLDEARQVAGLPSSTWGTAVDTELERLNRQLLGD